ncbi:MAG TPA: cysteine desulfurase family protein [Alphaproteobacteria bacterium]|jgi:cysteine desulfurase|nr:cysteine desulfurase family protein [Alphaproteobacteria bacterium]
MRPSVYLDYNATQPVKTAVRDAMIDILAGPTNASSVHRLGQTARSRVETARASVARLIGADAGEILFTSGATEANATVLAGTGLRHVLVSAVEHPSVRAFQGAAVVPVDGNGVIDLAALDRMLAEIGEPALVSVMLANNETGVIQPVAEAARIVHAHDGLLHSDAAQAPGRITVDVGALGVDLMTLSAHKMAGPQGAGALYIRDGLTLAPLLRGGGQEKRRRGGTENVAAIVGFGVAADLATDGPNLEALRDDMEARLIQLAPEITVHGGLAPRLGNTSCFGSPGLVAETALIALDLAGIAVSSGAACSSGAVEPSPVLLAMGVPQARAREAIRVSLGWATTPEEVDHLVESWSMVYRRTKAA